MKRIWEIYKEDMKNIATNWVVLILIGGLVILPSLYAWFNIKASWDPYGQTEQIPIGVVNEDEGATVRGEDIDVGKDLVESLDENKEMNWQFVDYDKAMEEVEFGNYYAVIVIPEDFSENLGTVVSGDPKKAEIDYYVNEKINAIAPKITDKGATVIVEEISSEFISTVNGVIFDMFNEIGLELEEDLPDIEQFKDYIFTMEESLPDIHDVLTDTDSDATEAKGIIEDVLGKIPETKKQTDEGLETINSTLTQVEKAKSTFNEISPKITEDLKKAQTIIHDINGALEKANEQGTISEEIDAKLGETKGDINTSIDKLNEVQTLLSKVQEQMDKENEAKDEVQSEVNEENEDSDEESEEENKGQQVPEQLQTKLSTEDVDKAKEEVDNLISVLEAMDDELDNVDGIGDKFDETLADIKEISQASTDKVDEFITEYTETIEPTISSTLKDVEDKLKSAKGLVVDIQETIPKAEKLLNSTNDNLNEGQDMLHSVLNEFPYVQDKVKETADKIRSVEEETDLNEIIDLLKNDPDAEQGFFAEPVKLNKNELFPIENYGTGMTPFYTVLALWVGALLLISLLSTDLPSEVYSAKQMYVGRLLTFISIGIFQTLIVTLGDIFLLGVNVSSPVWFVVFGLCISVTFMMIVYTVVSLLGDVGKATAIVLLVLQIAGSGGTYPVVLLPPFFQAINPFLPFTYAVDVMREAVGGIVWEKAIHDLLLLGMFAVIFVLIGLFLKKPLNSILNKMMASKGSRLFH